MITIKDIAEKAGVAKSTVSNVLTGKKYVSPEITEKILKICKENDYQQNFFASSLSNKANTNIIGLFLEESETKKFKVFYNALIESIITTASKSNINVLIYSGLNKDETATKLKAGRSPIDGAIILSPTIDDSRINAINQNLIPYVLIGHPNKNTNVNYVDTDNVDLTKFIASQMLKQGYKKICLINSKEKLVISKERNTGFIQAHEDVNSTDYVIYHSHSSSSIDGYRYADVALENGADAFITASGTLASGVYEACYKHNKEIGTEVAIFSLGYSFNESLKFSPSLSYALQDYYQFGKIATNILLNSINGEKTLEQKMIKSDLKFNESFKIE